MTRATATGRAEANLTQQLDAYASAHPERTIGWKAWLRGWPAYAAATGSSLALTTAADAGIIYSGPNRDVSAHATVTGAAGSKTGNNHAAFTGAGATFILDVLAKKGTVLGAHTSGAAAGMGGVHLDLLTNGAGGVFAFVKNLALNAKISSLAGGFKTIAEAEARVHVGSVGVTSGSFNPAQGAVTGFVGVKINNTMTSQTDYGWIRLQVSDNGIGDGNPHKITAIDWAYQNDGSPILAGDTGPLTTPAPTALTLLATGAAGVLAWRKMRQLVRAQPVAN
jgi:hypothetical protein